MRTVSSSPPPPYSPPRQHQTIHQHHHPGASNGRFVQTNRRSMRHQMAPNSPQSSSDGIVLSTLSRPITQANSHVHSPNTTLRSDQDESSFCSGTDTLVTSTTSSSGASTTPMCRPADSARWYRKYCNHRVPAVVVFGVVAAIFSVTYLYMVVVYRLQPTPVVDEAFHIPQAQKYCQGKFNEVCWILLTF